MTDYYEIIRFFNGYNDHLKKMLDFEYKKLDLINKGKIREIADGLPAEQAMVMQTNSFEAKRIKLLDGTADTFDELVEGAPLSCKKRLAEQHEVFRGYILKLKEINDTVDIIVSARLKKAERSSLETYNGSGQKNSEQFSSSTLINNV